MQHDPIDNPPDLEYKKDLPRSMAHFEEKPVTEKREVDAGAMTISIILTVIATPPALFGSGAAASVLGLFGSVGAMIFWTKNAKILEQKFPRLGFNPVWALYGLNCIAAAVAIVNFVMVTVLWQW